MYPDVGILLEADLDRQVLLEQVPKNSEMCLNLIRVETVWQKNLLHIKIGEL